MSFVTKDLEAALRPLIGRWVAQIYHAANMTGFFFTNRDSQAVQTIGWCLHVSCTWRLEDAAGIVTGSYDWMEHAFREDLLSDEWDPSDGLSLQERRLRSLLHDARGQDRTIWNRTNLLIVKEVMADHCGGGVLIFEGGYRLTIFPSTTRGEMWRIFMDSPGAKAFVAEAR